VTFDLHDDSNSVYCNEYMHYTFVAAVVTANNSVYGAATAKFNRFI